MIFMPKAMLCFSEHKTKVFYSIIVLGSRTATLLVRLMSFSDFPIFFFKSSTSNVG